MPYTKTDFSAAVDSHLATINAAQPLIGFGGSTPRGTIHDTRTAVFSRHVPTPNSVQLDCTFLDLSEIYINWADAYDTRKAAWHSNLYPASLGNGVAITKRHVIMSEFGSFLSDGDSERFLVWAGYDENGNEDLNYTTQLALSYVSWIVATEYGVGINGPSEGPSNDHLAYRICYLRDDLPDALVCKLINPATLPGGLSFLHGLPVAVITSDNQAGVQSIVIDPSNNWPAVELRPNPSLPFNYAYRPLQINGVGQPVFLLHGENTLVYFGHSTSSGQAPQSFNFSQLYTDNQAFCINYCHPIPNQPGRYFLDRILEACVRLNSKYAANFGGDPSLLPTYVT